MEAALARARMLSMTELARRLNLPESTMRYYCKRFEAYLPYDGEGRKRRYTPEAQSILEFIASAMHQNKNATAVELMLQAKQGGKLHIEPTTIMTSKTSVQQPDSTKIIMNTDFPNSGKHITEIMQRQADALEKISAQLGLLVNYLSTQQAQPTADSAAHNAQNTTPDDYLQKEISNLKAQMHSAEQIHQEDLEQLRKWLGHLGEAISRIK